MELGLNMFAGWFWPFFTDGWCLFDLVVVGGTQPAAFGLPFALRPFDHCDSSCVACSSARARVRQCRFFLWPYSRFRGCRSCGSSASSASCASSPASAPFASSSAPSPPRSASPRGVLGGWGGDGCWTRTLTENAQKFDKRTEGKVMGQYREEK